MAEVYLARDTQLGRRVAIKVLLGEADEGVTTARFNHPNIVTIHGVGEVSGRPYLALEFLEGQTLRRRMDRRRPGIPEAMRIALAMSRALAAAHGAGVLHRDLKPDNVMLGQDGRVRVLDFGLALSRTTPAAKPESADKEPSPELEATLPPAGVQGTPAYMAPEQWEEEALTARTDIWALGIIFFELLTGQRPYREASSLSQALRVCDGGEAAPQVQVDGVSPELVDLVRRCLDKEPEGRPEAGEVAEALQGLLNPLARSKQGISEPFRGLSAFNEQHSSLFFGRDGEIGQMVERLRREVVLPVVGPSGAGKSSLVRAGVIPRLREQGRSGCWRCGQAGTPSPP